MGIRKKIILGFIFIGSLLFISGIISSVELVRFNHHTAEILIINQSSIELSKKMLDAVQDQNTALLRSITDTSEVYGEMLTNSRNEFKKAFILAEKQLSGNDDLKKIKEAHDYYNSVVAAKGDSVTMQWFSHVYNTPYYNLTHSIKEFMVLTQQNLLEHTEKLERNAYRASMVGIIALAAGATLMFLFYYLINKFFISPVLRIRAGIRKYLSLKLPYDVKIDTHDEIKSLNDEISQIISQNNKTGR